MICLQGLMQCMVTVTMNDSSPEMLASIRRGHFAQPTDEERIEYLLQRKPRDRERPACEKHSYEHVMACQRRVAALKNAFMKRGSDTPLGRVEHWWDRTEAQMRGALHSHILVWMAKRKQPEGYTPLEPVPRSSTAWTAARQRPRDQEVKMLKDYQEDNCYHYAKMGRVWTEMVRPSLAGESYGGFADYKFLRIAGLALVCTPCGHRICLDSDLVAAPPPP